MTTDTAPSMADEPRSAWQATVQAEWTKLRTLPSTARLLAGATPPGYWSQPKSHNAVAVAVA